MDTAADVVGELIVYLIASGVVVLEWRCHPSTAEHAIPHCRRRGFVWSLCRDARACALLSCCSEWEDRPGRTAITLHPATASCCPFAPLQERQAEGGGTAAQARKRTARDRGPTAGAPIQARVHRARPLSAVCPIRTLRVASFVSHVAARALEMQAIEQKLDELSTHDTQLAELRRLISSLSVFSGGPAPASK